MLQSQVSNQVMVWGGCSQYQFAFEAVCLVIQIYVQQIPPSNKPDYRVEELCLSDNHLFQLAQITNHQVRFC